MSEIWQIKNIEEICSLIKGTEPGSNFYFDKPADGRVHFIRVGDLTGKVDNPKFVSKKLNNLTIVNPDDILISFDGTPGVVAKGWDGAIASGIRVIRNIKPEVLKSFLFYYLQTTKVQQTIKFYTTGVTILHASRAISHIEIPIPSISTQKFIVERLDAIKKTQKLNNKQVTLADELFRSLLHKELDSRGKTWELKKIGDIAGVTSSKRIFQSEYITDGIPFYRTKEIVELSQNKPISLELFISEERFDEINKKFGVPQKSDILISAVGTIGVSWIVPDRRKFYFKDGNLLWIKNFNDIDSYYLKLVLDNIFKSISELAAGAAYNALTIIKLKKIKISVPPLKTQREIVQKLQAVQDYKKTLLEQKQKLQELFDSCLNKMMNGEYV